jgi:histone H3
MARIHQHPRKNHGGKAPRKSLGGKKTDNNLAEAAGKQIMETLTKRRYRPGTKALREIRKYQKTTELLLRK